MDTMIGGLNSYYTNGMNAGSTANALEEKLNQSNLSSASDDELLAVCKDFEEYFVEQMVKSMMKMADIDGKDDDNSFASLFGMTEQSDAYMSTMSSYYGSQLVTKVSEAICKDENGGGLGLAQMLYEQMKRNYGVSAESTEE